MGENFIQRRQERERKYPVLRFGDNCYSRGTNVGSCLYMEHLEMQGDDSIVFPDLRSEDK